MPGIKGLNNSAENRFHKDTLSIVNFEQISYIVLVFLLLTLLAQSQQLKHQNNVWYLFKLNNKGSVFIANFEQISLITLMFLLLTLNQKMPVGMGFESILLNQQNVSITFFWKSVRAHAFLLNISRVLWLLSKSACLLPRWKEIIFQQPVVQAKTFSSNFMYKQSLLLSKWNV